MKKALVVLAVMFSLALVTSVYAQKFDDTAMVAEKMAKGKEFKFAGEIVSIDAKANTAMVKVTAGKSAGKTLLGRFDYAKFEGAYKGVADLKPGEKIAGVGVVVDGYNWVTRVADVANLPAAKPAPAPAPAKADAPAKK
jgi:hypothetical protein